MTGVRWSDLAAAEPELAEHGRRLIYGLGIGMGFLGTVRKDGGPRLHPVCPGIAAGGLWVFVPEHTVKWHDLRRDPRYALHAFPADEDEEFYVSGTARFAEDDAELRAAVTEAVPHSAPPHEALVELRIERALHTTWANWATPESHPVRTIWRAGD
jgi:hypothetical protein